MKLTRALLTAAALAAFTSTAADAPKKKATRAVLPDNGEKRAVTVFSDGGRMAGDVYQPKGAKAGGKLPAIVLCAGTGGTKGGPQARVVGIFAQYGYVVLAFD